MRISSTDVIEGGRVLYAIGKIKAATAWHAANGAPLQDNWRELVLSELIRRAEDIDADAIIGLDYETDGIVPVEETGVQLKRILATGIAVKFSSSWLSAGCRLAAKGPVPCMRASLRPPPPSARIPAIRSTQHLGVNELAAWHGAVHGGEKSDELLMPMLVNATPNHGSVEDVQGGKERGRA